MKKLIVLSTVFSAIVYAYICHQLTNDYILFAIGLVLVGCISFLWAFAIPVQPYLVADGKPPMAGTTTKPRPRVVHPRNRYRERAHSTNV